ncbi:uncharacterized protein LOC114426146 isoform X2 [Parambassis ranga]|uniref:Uncharacterized protein LOC114426146 isoform X2 n=1 Tax=Parambassis ranga TaxID=210632 RepID=A0A6P7HKR2_9TELE|nr:uncharacterized protein LOC114426146 isoform X2 [Parambassis ranga]
MATSGPRCQLPLLTAMEDRRAEDVGSVIECPPADLPEDIWMLEDTDDNRVPVLISSDEEDEGEDDHGEEEPHDVGDVLNDRWDDVDLPLAFGKLEIMQEEEDDMKDSEEEDRASEDSGCS